MTTTREIGSGIERASHRWIERASLLLMGIASVFVAVLNFRARHDFHTIDKHLVFRERILHGFAITDVMPSYPTPPTFPMWGYGWVLLLTTNRAALIALQMTAALLSAWYFLKTLDEATSLKGATRTVLRLLIVVCVPWYAFNSIDWSQSLATSLLIVSLSLLIRAVRSQPVGWLRVGISGVCFGLNLNLASDLYLLPFALAATYWLVAGRSASSGAHATVWLAAVGATLVPWMVYTWHATGTPLVKSTNQGHVLLIRLGQDPMRRFDITYSDGDPTMYAILANALGAEFARGFYASCSFKADAVLRRAFIDRIRRQPRDYLDLVAFRLRSVLTGATGTYGGEFDEGENLSSFGVPTRLRRLAQRVSERSGRLLQLGTTVFAPFALWAAIRRRESALAFALVTIGYQYLSCSIAVLQPQYVSNLILLQLLVCANGLGMLMSLTGS